jgi:hypothetical protein
MSAIAGTQAAARMKATTGPPTQYGHQQQQTLAKVVKRATACREANYSRTPSLTSGMTAAAWTIGTSWISTAAGPPESVGNSATLRSQKHTQQGCQQHQGQ